VSCCDRHIHCFPYLLSFSVPLWLQLVFHSSVVCISCNLDAWIMSVTLQPLYKVSFVHIFETLYCIQQSGFSIERSKNQLVQAQERIEATCGCIYEFVEFCFNPLLMFCWKINYRMMSLEEYERSQGPILSFLLLPTVHFGTPKGTLWASRWGFTYGYK